MIILIRHHDHALIAAPRRRRHATMTDLMSPRYSGCRCACPSVDSWLSDAVLIIVRQAPNRTMLREERCADVAWLPLVYFTMPSIARQDARYFRAIFSFLLIRWRLARPGRSTPC